MNELERAGSQGKPTRFRPLTQNRFFTGLWTQRSPLRDAATPYLQEKFYGSRNDALIDGANVELTNRLTLQRRPGLSVYNSQTFPEITGYYGFRRTVGTAESIKVLADTSATVYDATGPNTKTAIFTKSAGAGQTSFLGVGNSLFMANGVDNTRWLLPALQWTATTTFNASLNALPVNAAQPLEADYIMDSNGNIQVAIITGVSGASQPVWATIHGATTTDGTITWMCLGNTVVPWGIAAPTVAPSVTAVANSGTRFWQVNTTITLPYAIVDDNGNVQQCLVAGTTGPSYPSFNTTRLGITTDGSASWRNCGVPSTWLANYNYPSYATIIDPLGNIQIASEAHGTQITHNDVTGYGVFHSGAGSYTFVVEAVFADGTHTGTSQPITCSGSHFTLVWHPQDGVDHYNVWCTSASGAACTVGKIAGSGTRNVGSGPNFAASVNSIYLDDGSFYPYSGDATAPPASTIGTRTTGSVQLSGVSIPQFATTLGATTTDSGGVQPGITWTCYGSGQFAVFSGLQWVYCFHGVGSDVSTASPVMKTGAMLGSSFVANISAPGTDDPHCDSIWVFRTTDGGSTLLYAGQVANPGAAGTWTFTDADLDSDLNEFIQAPISDNNDQPLTGLSSLCFHLGRIWGSVGTNVYYSRTADATAGNSLTSFPPNNYIPFPSKVTKLFAHGAGLLVFTVSDVYLVQWSGTTGSLLQITAYLPGIGLLSPNAFDANGSLIYLHTSDGQIVAFDPSSGVSEIGFPIGDQITWNPTNSYIAWHVSGSTDKAIFVADGSTGWYRCTPTSAPETGLAWSPKATFASGCKAVQSIEVSPGVKRLLVAPVGGGPILQRDLTVFSDNGATYAAHATIGSIVLAQPGQLAELSFLATDCEAVGSKPTFGVRLDEISGTFDLLTTSVPDPPQLPASTTLYGTRYYFSQTQQAAWCRHMQIDLSWPSEAQKNEILMYTLFGATWNE